MKTNCIYMMMFLGFVVGCSSRDNLAYYQTHPKAVLTAIQTCSAVDTQGAVRCRQLEDLAATFRPWISEIEMNPQQFGLQIMKTQMRCATESLDAEKKQVCEQELKMRLAVVKWLESPES